MKREVLDTEEGGSGERERVCVCVRERERVSVRERERQGEKESVCGREGPVKREVPTPAARTVRK